tara:strand:+ start:3208 stop:3519 length:312 start_codon:yes stop_codon:yes gene_type:complete
MSYNRNKKHRNDRNYRNNRSNRDRQKHPPISCGKSPSNLTVVPRNNEHPERTVKRFLKKCKKLKIIETYREKTDYYIKPSVKRRRKAIRRLRAIKKDNQKKDL